MNHFVFYLIIGIILFDFFLDQILDYLNAKNQKSTLPDELKGIYDEEKYLKSREYEKINYKFSIITSTFNLILILGFIFFSGFAFVDNIARAFSSNPILIALIFFGIIVFISDLIHIPFNIYDTFIIEEKFGFNKTSPKTFVVDKIKGWIVGAIIGGGLLALFVWFYISTGKYFWLYAWALFTVFVLLMTMFYTSVIVPIFNKLKPLEEGELKNEITKFCKSSEFKLDNVFVIDGSKRSTKANAYFSGLGKKKKIVLFDTLIEKLNKEEIVAVLAHEIGHYKRKHTLVLLTISVIQTGITLYILSLFIGNPILSNALGVEEGNFHVGLIAFGFLYSPISMIIGLVMNIFSRKNEFEADHFASVKYKGIHLQNALKKLSVNNLSNLTPHPLYVFFNYSHPPLLQRLQYIDKIKSNES